MEEELVHDSPLRRLRSSLPVRAALRAGLSPGSPRAASLWQACAFGKRSYEVTSTNKAQFTPIFECT